VLNAAAYVVEIDRNGKARGVNAASYSGPSSGSMTPEAKADILDAEEDDPPPKKEEERVAAKFVEEEHREEGRVSFAVYLAYIKASGGYIAWLFLLFSFAIFCATTLTRSWWVSKWAGDADEIANKPEDLGISKNNHQDTVFYLLVYLGISLLTVVLTAVKVGTVLLASLRASRVLFRSLTDSVLQAKVRWLDTTPTGRILNRFIGDFEKVDDEISHSISQGAHFTFVLIGVVVADVYVSVWSLIPSAMLVLSCIWIARMYISGARDVRRLESNSKSPVLEHYTSSLAGLATIRGFGKREEYVQKMYDYIDKSARTEWIGHVVIGWMEFRQGFLGILFAVVVACGVVVLPGIGAPLAGFALSFALEVSFSSHLTSPPSSHPLVCIFPLTNT
jgi:ABC-type multidrug transport system fused ATPase/permease subunit